MTWNVFCKKKKMFSNFKVDKVFNDLKKLEYASGANTFWKWDIFFPSSSYYYNINNKRCVFALTHTHMIHHFTAKPVFRFNFLQCSHSISIGEYCLKLVFWNNIHTVAWLHSWLSSHSQILKEKTMFAFLCSPCVGRESIERS